MAEVTLAPLAVADAAALLRFEVENRDWFETWVGPRPDSYWQLDSLRKILRAQVEDEDLMYLIKAASGDILGRLNITGFQSGVGQIGYRVGTAHAGRGVATSAVALALPQARAAGLWALEAQVSADNRASWLVLERNGFTPETMRGHDHKTTGAGKSVSLTRYRLLLD